jgi:tRNA-dihydrouridine synthase
MVFAEIKTCLAPIKIGQLTIDPPLTLAPMAGQTTHAFRRLCREIGGLGLVCTELISSHALQYKGSRERTMEMFDWRESESPFAVQLFGSDPRMMGEALDKLKPKPRLNSGNRSKSVRLMQTTPSRLI